MRTIPIWTTCTIDRIFECRQLVRRSESDFTIFVWVPHHVFLSTALCFLSTESWFLSAIFLCFFVFFLNEDFLSAIKILNTPVKQQKFPFWVQKKPRRGAFRTGKGSIEWAVWFECDLPLSEVRESVWILSAFQLIKRPVISVFAVSWTVTKKLHSNFAFKTAEFLDVRILSCMRKKPVRTILFEGQCPLMTLKKNRNCDFVLSAILCQFWCIFWVVDVIWVQFVTWIHKFECKFI